MNRIRQIRENRSFSQTQLAEMIGTSQPTINRLEKGQRKLTVEWMQKIAAALQVAPSDLLPEAALAEFREDAEPYIPEGNAEMASSLLALGFSYYKVKTSCLSQAGLPPGKVVLIDGTAAGVEGRRTGDIVLAQASYISDPKQPLCAVIILRQFVAPGLLITNHIGSNTIRSIDSPDVKIVIMGVVRQGKTSA